jgi:kinesin family member 15
MIEIVHCEENIYKSQSLTSARCHFRKLVNVLSETTESHKVDLPYEQSRLTHVLKDTLGGNSRVIFLCSISSEHRYFLFLSSFYAFYYIFLC